MSSKKPSEEIQEAARKAIEGSRELSKVIDTGTDDQKLMMATATMIQAILDWLDEKFAPQSHE